jgi:hypothetical protein
LFLLIFIGRDFITFVLRNGFNFDCLKKKSKIGQQRGRAGSQAVKSLRCKARKYEGMRRTCVYRLRYKLAFYEVVNVTIPQSGALINRN